MGGDGIFITAELKQFQFRKWDASSQTCMVDCNSCACSLMEDFSSSSWLSRSRLSCNLKHQSKLINTHADIPYTNTNGINQDRSVFICMHIHTCTHTHTHTHTHTCMHTDTDIHTHCKQSHFSYANTDTHTHTHTHTRVYACTHTHTHTHTNHK